MTSTRPSSCSRRDWLGATLATSAGILGLNRLLLADEPAAPQRDPKLTERALKLMSESIVIDAYNCGPYSKHRHEPLGWFSQRGPTQVDLVKAVEGRLTAGGFDIADGIRAPLAIVGGRDDITASIKAGTDDWKDIPWPPMDGKPYAQTDYQRTSLANALMGLERFLREIELASGKVMLILKGTQIREAKKQGKIGIILHGNTSPIIEDSVELLHVWYRLGMRMMILARAGRNLICDGWLEGRTAGKLTTFGVRIVKEFNRLGMVLDGSHMSDASFLDLVETSSQPVICSHSNSRAICNHPRNLSDDMVKRLAKRGGVVGLTFPPGFIDLNAPREYLGYTPGSPLFQKWVDHCDHFMQLVGPDHIGIGSDFDGGGRLLEDMGQLPMVTEALLGRGYSEKDVKKILGQSLLRVFEQVIV